MKRSVKIGTAALLIAVLLVCSVSPMFATDIKRYYGDADNDGYIKASDARMALQIAAGIYAGELDDQDRKAIDMDADGRITTEDACLILEVSGGIRERTLIPDNIFEPNAREFTAKLNSYRSSLNKELSKLTLSDTLSVLATQAAKEYVTKTGTGLTREDGSWYYTQLSEAGVAFDMADKVMILSNSSYLRAYNEVIAGSQSVKAISSVNYDTIGIGGYSDDGRNFYWCILLIQSSAD